MSIDITMMFLSVWLIWVAQDYCADFYIDTTLSCSLWATCDNGPRFYLHLGATGHVLGA